MLLAKLRDVLRVGVVVLQRHFHAEDAAVGQLALGLEVDRLFVQHLLALVEMLDEFGDAAGVQELGGLLRVDALVGEGDFQALVEERQLAQAVGQGVVVEHRRLHDGGVGLEGDAGSGLAPGLAGFGQRRLWECRRRIPAAR